MSKAVIFFAPGLEECEGLLCVDILRRAGVEVTIAAVGGEKIVKSARQISVVADALAEELDYTVFDACILPGGIPGVPNLKADATVRRVCRDFAAEGKVVAAICAAPTALAAFGVAWYLTGGDLGALPQRLKTLHLPEWVTLWQAHEPKPGARLI